MRYQTIVCGGIVALIAGGCELITAVDRSKIPDDGSGAASTGGANAGGHAGQPNGGGGNGGTAGSGNGGIGGTGGQGGATGGGGTGNSGGTGGQGGSMCVPEICDGADNDCDGTADDGCEVVTIADDSCYKAALISGGVVVDGTDDNTSCSSGVFVASWAPGEILQVWENDANFSFNTLIAPSLVEWRCSPSNSPPDWTISLSQSQLTNYQTVEPTVVGNDYTIALTGCTRYLIRITRGQQ